MKRELGLGHGDLAGAGRVGDPQHAGGAGGARPERVGDPGRAFRGDDRVDGAQGRCAGADGEAAKEKSSDEAAAAEGTRLENERVIEEMFTQQAAAFTKAASKGVIKDDGSVAVAEEETDVKDVRLLLKLLKV